MQEEIEARLRLAQRVARRAGELALRHFRALDQLTIESKGHQDPVSNADREVEILIRDAVAIDYPADGFFGEEHDPVTGTSGYAWVVDPIDGTANFVAGIPAWCVSIACVREGETVVGVIHEPSTGETFSCRRGGGAFLDGRPMRASNATLLSEGTVGTGFSNRREARNIVPVVEALIAEGGMFYRNASGALMLAYVAAGRLLAYCEEHMNAWDCLAGLLLVEEAGGRILRPDPATVVERGTMVIAAASGVYRRIEAICDRAFTR